MSHPTTSRYEAQKTTKTVTHAEPVTEPAREPRGGLDRYFHISERGSTVGREVRGGLVTFFTMAYILALNPIIIGTAPDKYGRLISGLPVSQPGAVPATMAMVAAGTALIAGLMTLLMGAWAKFPVALATGLGINALAAYVIAPKMSWPQALALIVAEGIVITLLVLTGFREAVFRAVPKPLRAAISVGIGLFIAFIGLWDGGVVRAPFGGATPVELGVGGTLQGWPIFVFIATFLLVAVLYIKRVKGSLLIALLGGTLLAFVVQALAKVGPMIGADGKLANPTGWKLTVPEFTRAFDLPNFGTLGQFWPFGVHHADPIPASVVVSMILLAFSLLLTDFFDTMGTVVAVGSEAGLLDKDGNPPHLNRILTVDSLAAIAGGMGGVSSNTSYIESAAGVGEGARTGLASVVTGAAFLVSILLTPLVTLIPAEAASPILLFVGFLMMSQVTQIDWEDAEEALPAFLTIVLMPFAYSITAGIGAGFILYVVLKALRGRASKIHPLLWIVAAAFLLYFMQGLFTAWIK